MVGDDACRGTRWGQSGFRKLIDRTAAQRLESLLKDAQAKGGQLNPSNPRADGKRFPVSLVTGMNQQMRLFQEEAFGPVVGVMGLPDKDFAQHALRMANSSELSGDLAASLFTSQPESQQTRRIAWELKQGIVAVNTYPGVAFATSLPWGAGPAGLSGRGWVHNYQFVTRSELAEDRLNRAAWQERLWSPVLGGSLVAQCWRATITGFCTSRGSSNKGLFQSTTIPALCNPSAFDIRPGKTGNDRTLSR